MTSQKIYKNFNDYDKQYKEEILKSFIASNNTDTHVVDESVWIAFKWTEDNNTAPFKNDFEEKLNTIKDERLLDIVLKGCDTFIKHLNCED